MTPDAPRDTAREATDDYSTWTIEDREGDEFRYLGLTGDGSPMFFHPSAKVVFRGVRDEASRTLSPADEESLEEELGAWLDRVAEETGWESLSSFARERLEAGESANS